MALRDRRLSLRQLSGAELLIALIVLFVSFPFVETLRAGGMIKSILLTLVLVSALLAIAGHGRILTIAAIMAAPALAARWINQYRPDLMPPEVFLIFAIVFVAFVIGNLLRFVLQARSISTEVLCAGISTYMLLGLLWTFAYWLVAELSPGAFSFNVASEADPSMKGFNGLYFSLITLNTVGYGDISPVSRLARMLAAMEAMTGLLYVAVLIARLVGLHIVHANTSPNE